MIDHLHNIESAVSSLRYVAPEYKRRVVERLICAVDGFLLSEGWTKEDGYERIAAWYEAGHPIPRDWAAAAKVDNLRPAYIRAGLPGFEP